MKLESARGGPILGGSSSFCRDSHVPDLWGEHVSCSRRGGTGHTSLTSEGPPRVPLKPEWWSEHTRGYLVGAPLFSSHPENKQGFPSSDLSTVGLDLGLEIQMLARRKLSTPSARALRPRSTALAFLSVPVTTAGAQGLPKVVGGHL